MKKDILSGILLDIGNSRETKVALFLAFCLSGHTIVLDL